MRVHSVVNINFSNGLNVDVEQCELGVEYENKNVLLETRITEELSEVNKNPIGTIAFNNIVLKLETPDNSLTPENIRSPYYGYMNSTAILRMLVIDKNDDKEDEIQFGTFYVERWYSNISSEQRKSVTIEGSGYMKQISKMAMPAMPIKKNELFLDYLLELISKQNEKLDDRYKISVDDDLEFKDFTTMKFSDIEASKIGEALEIISQCTLTNLYIDRDNKLKSDYCFDDSASQSVGTLGDCINLKSIKVGDGGLSDYSGVEVTYNNYIVNNTSNIVSLNDQALPTGNTEFNGINTGCKLFKLNGIKVETTEGEKVKIDELKYDKNTINVKINNVSDSKLNGNILFYGQSLNESPLTYAMQKSNSNGTVLQLTNNLIQDSMVRTFTSKILKLIGIKNNTIEATGWIDPHIKLGDIIYLDAEKTVNTKGYYKVVRLDWQIKTTIFCNIKLHKLVS